jgi:ribonucleotide monophosphatase NagD (HAD superfamily)
LAGHQTLCQVAVRWMGRNVYLIASPAMRLYAAGLRLVLTESDADVVVLLRDTDFSYSKLALAANLLRRCKRLVLSNPDLTHPADHDAVVPETGALLAALSACLDETVTIDAIGKPEPLLFQTALTRAGVMPQNAVMIGDNPSTDGAGAKALGIPFVLVRPGTEISLEALWPMLPQAPSQVGRSEAFRR